MHKEAEFKKEYILGPKSFASKVKLEYYKNCYACILGCAVQQTPYNLILQ